MPGLIAFNRRWGIGSDDFVFPAFLEFLLRLFWFVAVLIVYLKRRDHPGCLEAGQQLLVIFLIGLLVELLLILLLDVIMMVISSKGTMTQTRPRRHLPKVLYLRFFLVLIEIIWNGIGTKWAFTQADHDCESQDVVFLIQGVVIFSWVMVGAILLGVFLVFDPIGTHSQPVYNSRVSDTEQSTSQPHLYINLSTAGVEKAKRVWEWRMNVIFCCYTDEQSRRAFSEIAKLFAIYFEDVDLVPSDIAAGLFLLHEKQRMATVAKQLSTPQHYGPYSVQSPDSVTSTGAVQGSVLSSPGVFTPVMHQTWMTIEMASYMMKFAIGSYGWPMFLYSDGLMGLCKLWNGLKCFPCCCKRPNYIIDDNCCHCHTSTLMKVTGLKDEDLIYVSFHNRVYEVPFYVAVDHQTNSVIVTIRGTLSIFDTLTDLTAESDYMMTDSCPHGFHCHRGMLRAAQFVHRKLDESHALSDAFALHQNYTLVIAGHSLGAGTAALLAILLRPLYPNLRCFAYSPPGGMLSNDGVKHTEDFVFSITLGDDLVPRLSVPNMEDMKRKLLSCVLDCEVPKYKIFLSQIFHCFSKSPPKPGTTAAQSRPLLEHFGQSTSNSNGNYTTNSSQEVSSEGSQGPGQSRFMSQVPLFVPGRILNLTILDSDAYRAHWVSPEYFHQIMISPRMVSDHMPHILQDALNSLTTRSFGECAP